MARLAKPGADGALRAHLLADAKDFRRTYVETQLDDPDWRDYVWRETSKPVDALQAGEPCRITRGELPDGHPQRVLGSIRDSLVLGSDDVLREADSRLHMRA